MLNRLIAILHDYKDIDYLLFEKKTYGPERFYVKKQLEMGRYVDVHQFFLTIYKAFDAGGKTYRGSSQIEIHPTFSEEEIKKAIEEASYAAGFVKNEEYPLAAPADFDGGLPSIADATDLNETADRLRSIVYAEDHYENGYLSFAEFFVKYIKARIINSKGVDLQFSMSETYVETAVNWNAGTAKEEHEIEIYESYTMALSLIHI